MIELRQPFTIYAKNKQSQAALVGAFNQGAVAEPRDLVSVYVTPLLDAPLAIGRLVEALPHIDTMRSSYMHGLMEMVREEASSQAKAAQKGNGRPMSMGRTP